MMSSRLTRFSALGEMIPFDPGHRRMVLGRRAAERLTTKARPSATSLVRKRRRGARGETGGQPDFPHRRRGGNRQSASGQISGKPSRRIGTATRLWFSDTSMAGPGDPAITCGTPRNRLPRSKNSAGQKPNLHSGMFGRCELPTQRRSWVRLPRPITSRGRAAIAVPGIL